MDVIEFDAKIKNGMIEIPDQYLSKIKDRAKVRVTVSPEKKHGKHKTLIDQLLKQPTHIQGFTPLSRDEIYE